MGLKITYAKQMVANKSNMQPSETIFEYLHDFAIYEFILIIDKKPKS